MSEIRELSLNEIAMVSGGEGHGSEVNRDRQDVAAGAVLGGLGASMPTSSSSSNRNSGGGWHDSNPGSVAGQCRW